MSAAPGFGPRSPGSVVLDGVAKRFGGIAALDDVSFSLEPGTLAAVVGPNGSGKTTLLRIIGGTLESDAGRVEVCGRPSRHGDTAFVPPGDRGLYWRLSGRHNLEFFARISRSWRADRWREAASAMGADGLLGRRVGTCSTGERRRLAIAAGFVTEASVVLLDEPYSDLDDEGQACVERLLGAWTGSGGVVLYAAPTEGAGPTPDRLINLREGSVWVPAR